MRRPALAGWLLALAVVVVMAASAEAAAPAPSSSDGPSNWRWSDTQPDLPWERVLGGTMVVVALVCVGVYVVKKLDRGGLLRKGRHLEVLETRIVGRKLQLYLVRVADRVVLLAQTGNAVTRVAELDKGELPSLDAQEQPATAQGFGSMLKKLARASQ